MTAGKPVSLAKKLVVFALKITVAIVKLVFKGALAIGAAAWRGVLVAKDMVHARGVVVGQHLRCPEGHVTPIHGIFRCERCGFTYRGDCLRCGNPECRATTAYVPCSTCGSSIRSPYRWGH